MNITKEQLALKFHETYERLAPEFGYETRSDTKKFDPESNNGRLMIAVCESIMRGLEDAEPVAWMHPTSSFSVITQEQKDSNSLQYSDEFLAGHTVPLYTSPQAAQTATVGPYDLKCKDVIDYPFQAAQTDEREAFEAWPRACREIIDRWVAPDMYKYAVAMLDLAIQADQARRAGRKG